MNTKTALIGFLGWAAVLLAGGCASVPSTYTPVCTGYLVYYDDDNYWLWYGGNGWMP